MKIVVDMPGTVVKKIQRLVESGKYSSISDFVNIASENQITLEETDTEIIAAEIGRSPQTTNGISDFSYPKGDVPTTKQYELEETENIWDSWLWGQINRILPVKFAVRYLAIKSEEISDFPLADDIWSSASKSARSFGHYLEKKDLDLGKKRDERLSTGFPIGKDAESSKDRYWTQFIGYEKNDGTRTGALFELGFADLINKGDTLNIGLTPAGNSFARIVNPVIDKNEYINSLSVPERKFYLDHIQDKCPGEWFFIKLILDMINDGIDNRGLINDELEKIVEDSGWSSGLVSTQRSGVISRMYELKLIAKKRDGLEVKYLLTDFGKNIQLKS